MPGRCSSQRSLPQRRFSRHAGPARTATMIITGGVQMQHVGTGRQVYLSGSCPDMQCSWGMPPLGKDPTTSALRSLNPAVRRCCGGRRAGFIRGLTRRHRRSCVRRWIRQASSSVHESMADGPPPRCGASCLACSSPGSQLQLRLSLGASWPPPLRGGAMRMRRQRRRRRRQLR